MEGADATFFQRSSVFLLLQHLLLAPPRAALLLLTDPEVFLLFPRLYPFDLLFDFADEKFVGFDAIQVLLAEALYADGRSRGAVRQLHAAGGLVDFLPAVTAPAREEFVDVFGEDLQFGGQSKELGREVDGEVHTRRNIRVIEY